MAAQGTMLAQITQQVVPRTEQELRWRLSEERQDRIEQEMREDRQETRTKLDSLDVKMDVIREEVRGSRLPRWAYWVLGILAVFGAPLLAVWFGKLLH